jgi:prepilin-type N-terminal cleavage/methylation domain-containing protein
VEPLNHEPPTRRAGFTLVEVAIAMTVLGLILGAIGLTALRGKENFRQGVSVAVIEARAERLLDRIAEELRYAGRDSLPVLPLPPAGASTIEFRACEGFDGAATLWSNRTSIARVADPRDPEDGIDNDGDGVVDEGQVVLTRNLGEPDQIAVVIGGGVRRFLQGEEANVLDDNGNGLLDERGLSFALDGTSSLTIRLSLEAVDPRGLPLVRTVQTTVSMRN